MKRAGGRRRECDESGSEQEEKASNWQQLAASGVGRAPAVCYCVLERFRWPLGGRKTQRESWEQQRSEEGQAEAQDILGRGGDDWWRRATRAISISFFICAHKIVKIFILIVFIGSIRYIFEC